MPNSILQIFLLALWILFSGQLSALAQKSKKQLEKEKKENLRKLAQANEILKEVSQEKKVSISQLRVLKQKTRLKEQNISSIQTELGMLQSDIHNLEGEQQNLALTLVNIKKEYAAMVYAASKASITNQLMFLFASSTFNQFLMRLQYLRFYAEARRNQAHQIQNVSLNLSRKQEKLTEVKQGKEVLLTTEQQEKLQLESLKESQKQVVSELAKREAELREKIEKHKAAVRRLDDVISNLVKAEIRKSRNLVGPPKPDQGEESSEQKMVLTPEGKLISKSFSGNKSRLSWPVENGFISSGFGRHEHPVLKKVYVDNLGVDISTKVGEKVHSVFEGTVGLVGEVPGMEGKIVMIRHGEYFTVYSGLRNVGVSAGDKVKVKQVLGEVSRDDEEGAVLQFQIWKNHRKLDPEDWLAKD
jgi:septal ring factor EnvC (AmiA/AmiB activator)